MNPVQFFHGSYDPTLLEQGTIYSATEQARRGGGDPWDYKTSEIGDPDMSFYTPHLEEAARFGSYLYRVAPTGPSEPDDLSEGFMTPHPLKVLSQVQYNPPPRPETELERSARLTREARAEIAADPELRAQIDAMNAQAKIGPYSR